MKKTLGLFLVFATMFLVACGGDKSASNGEEKAVRYNLQSNPPQLDPQLNTDSTSGTILGHVFEGLTKLGTKNETVPAIAESWTNEGNIWTFKLRADAKWHNGDPVVAGDFLASWERVLNPKNGAEYSYIMYSIKGAQEYNEGKTTDFTTVGVKAVDDKTLVVELKEPVAYFASLVSFYTFLPQNQKFFEEHKDTYASSMEDILGNGPYKMSSWEFENKIILEKADTYWNKDSIKITKIEMLMINDNSAGLKAYQNDELDIAMLPTENFAEYKDSTEKVTWEDGGVWYLQLNTGNKIFSNKNIRKALALGIDRKALVEKVKGGAGSVAESFVPSIIPGKEKSFRDENPQTAYGLAFDPVKAKELFAQGLKELGMTAKDIGKITLLTDSRDAAMKEAQFYQEQLKINVGIDVTIEPLTFQIRLQRMSAKDYDMAIAGWSLDYMDPMTYLDLWLSNSGQNNTLWGNAEYDKLIGEAKASGDNALRMDAMAKAEKLLMEELPIVPIYYRKKVALHKPFVIDVIRRAGSPDPDFTHGDIQK